MKLRNILLLLLLALGAVSTAYADSMDYSDSAAYGNESGRAAWYFGVTSSSFDFERTGLLSTSYNTYGYVGVLGVDLGPYLAIEARGAQGDQATDVNGLSLSVRELTAAYGRLNLPLDNGRFVIYALGGFATINVKGELGAVTHTKTLSGSSYGVGFELYGSQNTALTVEYMRYLAKRKYIDAGLVLDDKFDINAVSFGIVHHF